MLLALLLALAPVQSVPTLAADAEARWVPFEITEGNHIRFDMDVDGRPARAILDSGVTDSFVTGSFARRIGLRTRRREKATAIGGQVDIGWAEAATLSLGALVRAGAPVAISDTPGLDRFGADLFIGADLIACCALEIDYDARRFRFLPSGRMPFAGAVLPLDRSAHGLLRSQAMLGGQRLRPLIVDTGDGGGLTLARSLWAALRGRAEAGPSTSTIGWGMGGATVTETTIVRDLDMAGLRPAETELRVEAAAGFSARAGAAGRIGNALLMRFHLLLDPGAGRMVLAPGARLDSPVIRSTSGLLMAPGTGRLRIVHVMRGSPAEQGGWREGDAICASDGAPVAGDRLPDWSAGTPGRRVRLTLCDGSERVLELRRFY
jgi:hypothetical protein